MVLLPICTIRSESDNAMGAATYAVAGLLSVSISAESLLYDILVS